MKKITKLIIITFIFLLTGCYNYKELNESAIISGIAIDVGENKKYKVSIQIMNAKKKEEESVSRITFYESEGNTLYEAMQNILLDSPKDLYDGHNEIVIISDALAKKENPINYMDYFIRENITEKDSLVMLSKDINASDVLKIITPLETIPSENLKSSLLESSKSTGKTTLITIDEFIADILKEGKQLYIPAIEIEGDIKEGEDNKNIESSDPNTRVKYSTIAIFKDNKFYTYLSSKEALALSIISKSSSNANITFKCNDNNYGSVKIQNIDVKKDVSYNENFKVKINLKLDVNVQEYNCKVNFINDDDAIKKVEKEANKEIKKIVNDFLNTVYKEYKTDVLGFSHDYYKKNYNTYKKKNLSIDKLIDNISFDITTSVNIKSPELSLKSIKGGDTNEQ